MHKKYRNQNEIPRFDGDPKGPFFFGTTGSGKGSPMHRRQVDQIQIPCFDGAPDGMPGGGQSQSIADQWSARQRLQPSRAPRNLGRFAASLLGYGFYGLLIMGAGFLGLIILSALFSAI